MKEIEWLEKMLEVQTRGEPAALATVIRTKGSVPRKAGTRMMIWNEGKLLGTIGGGCGEAEVIERAYEVMKSGKAVQHRVDLTLGLFYEDGGICGGVMDVLIEPLVKRTR
ncbi:XdhC family protein [Ammoniphilus sp. YIM 78166]|uniref:XdhC family protein n=1 Tax=Ammoniphilus sp. YIM 78166 TaxID=1644106 RepID=UPI00106FA597|nr:XdhC family protein [Ammoniphilus sp. YIM 78166]